MTLSVCYLTADLGPRRRRDPTAAASGRRDTRGREPAPRRRRPARYSGVADRLIQSTTCRRWNVRRPGCTVSAGATGLAWTAMKSRCRPVLAPDARSPRRVPDPAAAFLDEDHWLSEWPWAPDHQNRLVRNDPVLWVPGLLHSKSNLRRRVVPRDTLDHLSCRVLTKLSVAALLLLGADCVRVGSRSPGPTRKHRSSTSPRIIAGSNPCP